MTRGSTPAKPLRAFVAELIASGVRDCVVCPGSRSMPLALALRAHPDMRVLMHLDERAAGYFALGLARAARRPVALLGTSGTAVVNFAPAVVEASLGRVPLIVLTADRPPELRDRGAAQTIDQAHLFGRFARWYAELPVPEEDPTALALVRDTVDRAVATALDQPMGPVHLNLPYRAPLLPEGSLAPDPFVPATTHRLVPPTVRSPHADDLDALAVSCRTAARPLIVAGPLDHPGAPPAITRLAAAIGAPILADALANLRLGGHDRSLVVPAAEALLRSGVMHAQPRPDLVIRFGAALTSTAIATYLEGSPQVVVDEGAWNDPTLAGGTLVRADPAVVATAIADRVAASPMRGTWQDDWLSRGRIAAAAVRATIAACTEPFEGSVFAALADVLPAGAIVHVGSSMPVRDLDAFLTLGTTPARFVANRGVNGIDGVVSSALGAAAAGVGPVLLIVGDLSFLHDLNALIAARLHDLALTIVLLDNDGGGIFSFLPQGTAERPELGLPEHYEELFGTPHGLDLLAMGRLLGAATTELTGPDTGDAIAASMRQPGVRLLRLRTDRARNVVLHRMCWDAASAALG